MSIARFVPPLDFLRVASRTSLQSFELARLNHAANLRREIAVLIDQWVQETSEATLARWMLDHHKSLRDPQPSSPDALNPPLDQASDFLSDISEPPADIVPAPPRFSRTRSMRGSLTQKPQKPGSTAVG